MIATDVMHAAELNDAELVSESLGGNRDAFRQIVERYQTLIASLAYCATGNVTQSEDLAQETFVKAWKQLADLREPAKLRSWLCSIARFLISKESRRQGREPIHAAEPLDAVADVVAPEPLPADHAVTEEEKALLWRSLERIPATYREPLVLFYREHQSVGQVAAGLELSEDAVKQRLARGRKLLQEQVQAFVESALCRTAPGPGFSVAVVAMLPAVAGPAAASVGVGAKGTAVAKSGFLAACLATLAPFLGIAAGIGAQWLIIRNTTSERGLRRRRLLVVIAAWVLYLGLFVGLESTMHWLARHFEWGPQVRFLAFAGFYWFFLGATLTVQLVMLRRVQARRQARVEAGETGPRPMMPMQPGPLAAVVGGGHLALFSWLMALAWRLHDPMGVAVIAGATLLLSLAAFFRVRAATPTDVVRVTSSHVALCGVVILLTLNQRIDVWVASAYGVTAAEAHHLQPLWLVPVLSLALVVWTALVLAVTRPKRRLPLANERV
jgi:RNA polymerase sigma factor (sigma-70 family)